LAQTSAPGPVMEAKPEPKKTAVNTEKLLADLEAVAEKISVKIRYERITGGPIKTTHGACRIRGENVILIDRRLGTIEKLHALGKELRRFDLENVYISPAARAHLQLKSE